MSEENGDFQVLGRRTQPLESGNDCHFNRNYFHALFNVKTFQQKLCGNKRRVKFRIRLFQGCAFLWSNKNDIYMLPYASAIHCLTGISFHGCSFHFWCYLQNWGLGVEDICVWKLDFVYIASSILGRTNVHFCQS